MAGRPSKLTPEVIEELSTQIGRGLTYALACKRAGITYQTFRRWRAGRFPKTTPVELQEQFCLALKRAEAQLIYELLCTIRAHGFADLPGDWRTAAWFLERRYPQHFGRRRSQKVPGATPSDRHVS